MSRRFEIAFGLSITVVIVLVVALCVSAIRSTNREREECERRGGIFTRTGPSDYSCFSPEAFK